MPDATANAAPDSAAPLLVVDHASKSFGAVRAMEDGWIELRRGEAHALVGENGAGKSTLVKILAGVHRPDSGRVLLDGVEVVFDTTAQSHAAGIAIIFQEPTLFPDLTVAENVFIGAQPLRSFRRIDVRRMRREAAGLFEQLGVKLDPDRIARGLSIADQQIVEIAKALSADARVIVMDEPTAALTQTEVERLFRVVETLRARGAAVLFISHRLDEVFALCQRVTVMRDGRHVVTEAIADTSTQKLIHAMVGRDLDALFPKEVAEVGADRAQGRPADARGRVHGCLVRGQGRRDRRARRSRRRRPLRGGARDLRHRPRGCRRRRGARPPAPAGLAERRDGRGHRLRAGGSGASRGSSCRSRSSATWRSPRSTA